MVVSCKAWQTGFRTSTLLAQLRGEVRNPKRPVKLMFRELLIEKWADAFRARVKELTATGDFTHCLAVTKLLGNGSAWGEDETIRSRLDGNPLRFLTLTEMWDFVQQKTGTAPSEIGRLAQLLRAAGVSAHPHADKFLSNGQYLEIKPSTASEIEETDELSGF
jgi:hypothetical protein